MKFISRHIIYYFCLLLALPMLTSCIYDDFDGDAGGTSALNSAPRISLNIVPLSLGPVNADVTEMIGTLRVIILSETTEEVTDEATGEVTEKKTSYVEYNEYFDFTGSQGGDMFTGNGQVANTFSYIITRNTVPGLKKFYLIANENQVTPISFQGVEQENFPTGVSNGMELKKFLDHYTPDLIPGLEYPEPGTTPEAGEPKGAEFEQLVNTIYYTPEFTQTTQNVDGGTRNVIFLPYTSHYEFALATKADIESGNSQGAVNILDGNIYLAPCATKFRFEFQNYRENSVVIDSFQLSGMATDMFLFAQVYGDDLYKNYGAEKGLWWIDWLARVSAASQSVTNPDDNLSFNSAYGWMNLYDIPESAIDYNQEGSVMDNDTRYGVAELIQEGYPITIDGRAAGSNPVTGTPGSKITGYFYFPESRYMVDFPMYDDNGNWIKDQELQAYYLKLSMKSGDLGLNSAVKDTQIANLGSMFRNTKAYITIKLRDALDVGAYAQIEPWDESHTNGTVIEEPSNE